MTCYMRYLDRIFVTHNIPQENNIAVTRKITQAQTRRMAMIVVGNGHETLLTGLCRKRATYSIPGSQEIPKTANLATVLSTGLAKASNLERPSKGQDPKSKVRCGHPLT